MKSRTRIRVGIVTVSDSCAAGRRQDESGDYLKSKVSQLGWQVVMHRVVPDEERAIAGMLKQLSDREKLDLVLTTGGTGLAKRDVTPEATRKVIEKEIPGIAEAMRMQTFRKTPFSILSRSVCGWRKKTLIINLPGSLKAVKETWTVILPVIAHAVDIMGGRTRHHGENKQKSH